MHGTKNQESTVFLLRATQATGEGRNDVHLSSHRGELRLEPSAAGWQSCSHRAPGSPGALRCSLLPCRGTPFACGRTQRLQQSLFNPTSPTLWTLVSFFPGGTPGALTGVSRRPLWATLHAVAVQEDSSGSRRRGRACVRAGAPSAALDGCLFLSWAARMQKTVREVIGALSPDGRARHP